MRSPSAAACAALFAFLILGAAPAAAQAQPPAVLQIAVRVPFGFTSSIMEGDIFAVRGRSGEYLTVGLVSQEDLDRYGGLVGITAFNAGVPLRDLQIFAKTEDGMRTGFSARSGERKNQGMAKLERRSDGFYVYVYMIDTVYDLDNRLLLSGDTAIIDCFYGIKPLLPWVAAPSASSSTALPSGPDPYSAELKAWAAARQAAALAALESKAYRLGGTGAWGDLLSLSLPAAGGELTYYGDPDNATADSIVFRLSDSDAGKLAGPFVNEIELPLSGAAAASYRPAEDREHRANPAYRLVLPLALPPDRDGVGAFLREWAAVAKLRRSISGGVYTGKYVDRYKPIGEGSVIAGGILGIVGLISWAAEGKLFPTGGLLMLAGGGTAWLGMELHTHILPNRDAGIEYRRIYDETAARFAELAKGLPLPRP